MADLAHVRVCDIESRLGGRGVTAPELDEPEHGAHVRMEQRLCLETSDVGLRERARVLEIAPMGCDLCMEGDGGRVLVVVDRVLAPDLSCPVGVLGGQPEVPGAMLRQPQPEQNRRAVVLISRAPLVIEDREERPRAGELVRPDRRVHH